MAEMQIQKSEEIVHRLAGIIWGDAKTGKTTWAMSLPGRKLLINFDPDGYLSVAHRNDFDLLDLSVLAPSEAISQGKKAATYIVENADKYESVIVDSLTTLTNLSLYDAVLRGIGKSNIFIPTLEAPGLSGYGARNNNANDIVDKIMRATGQKKLNCFFIAHTDDPEYDKKGENIVQHTMMLSAKIRNAAAIKVSEIYHLSLGPNNRRVVYLSPFGNLKPMGSRIFDTKVVSRFDLKYDPEKPDVEQSDSLLRIISKFEKTKGKLKEAPK